jgi:CBS domain-containing protein
MRCEELMKKDVITVSPQDSVLQAARYMKDQNIGFIPVCDQDKKVVGTLTDRDITIRVVAESKDFNTKVDSIMSKDVVSCRPTDDLEQAELLMMDKQKSRIVCLDDQGKLAGVISLSDIAQAESGDKASDVLRDVSEREAPPLH